MRQKNITTKIIKYLVLTTSRNFNQPQTMATVEWTPLRGDYVNNIDHEYMD